MKHYLVESTHDCGRQSAAEFSKSQQAMAAAIYTFRTRPTVRRVVVRDPDGHVIYGRTIQSRPKGLTL
jgi:hypothetical protein